MHTASSQHNRPSRRLDGKDQGKQQTLVSIPKTFEKVVEAILNAVDETLIKVGLLEPYISPLLQHQSFKLTLETFKLKRLQKRAAVHPDEVGIHPIISAAY